MFEYLASPGKGRDVNSCLRTGGRASCRWPVECQEQPLTQNQSAPLEVYLSRSFVILNLRRERESEEGKGIIW